MDAADTRKVIEFADRYAAVGAPLLLGRLEQSTDLALPGLYVMADILADIVTETAARSSDLSF